MRAGARGSVLIPAIFLIVVVAILGVFAIRIGMNQQQTVSAAVLGERALAAANTGIEWGAYQAMQSTPASPCNSSTTNQRTLNLTQGALAGFSVTVGCSYTDHIEGVNTLHVFELDSFAQYSTLGQPDYVSRRVSARFANGP
jgi:MSHA biogenesis protein MshP